MSAWLRPKRCIGWVLIVCAVFGGGVAFLFYYAAKTYDVSALEHFVPKQTSKILCADGKALGLFFDEDREPVSERDLPDVLKHALFAAEDKHFLSHHGVDGRGIARALWTDIWARKIVQGGSTLSQQLAKMMFLNQERTIKRKVLEAVLAFEIEWKYPKEKILEMYSNNIYLGSRSYGFEAASRRYFGKSIQDISADEAALLVSMIPSPARFSPITHPEIAVMRRNRVLEQMADLGFLNRDEAMAAEKRPIRVVAQESYGLAPFVRLEVEKFLRDRFGYALADLQVKGITIGTTIRCDVEEQAKKAIQHLASEYDKRHQWRGKVESIFKQKPPQTVDSFYSRTWEKIASGSQVEGLITEVAQDHVSIRIGTFTANLDLQHAPRVQGDFTKTFHEGDVALFEIDEVDVERGTITVGEMTLEASLVAMDETGAILALVGGVDFEASNFDRVMAHRQAGSAFKPIVYASFLETELAKGIVDPWLVRLNDSRQCYRSRPKPYCPENFKHIKPQYAGVAPALRMITESRNAATVSAAAHIAGIKQVVDMARRLGVSSQCEPYLPTAIGACDVTLLEMTNAFSTIASLGIKREPFLVEYVTDNLGNTLYDRREETEKKLFNNQIVLNSQDVSSETVVEDEHAENRVISVDVAKQVLVGMRSVAEAGTAMRSRELPFPIAGKTGTTNDSTDAWFIGVTPEFRIGMWAGFDAKLSLGERETGGLTVLPSWMRFVEAICADTSCGNFDEFVETKLRELMPKAGLKMKGPKERKGFAPDAGGQNDTDVSE
ncbi:transglycosylase domain-containing protein [Patescibacteria group bacterium]|nr:transglycosylase domain-containing protein [Patescibacteria group bacterium]